MTHPSARRSLPPLTAVRSFEAAARLGSFSLAADALGVTHGAVSRQVKLLEEWAGAPLFHRHGKRVTLSDVGRAFADRAGYALDELALAGKALRASVGEQRPVLTINALPTFAMRWLLPRLTTFQNQYAGVELRLITSDEPLSRATMASFDIAIRRAHETVGDEFHKAAFLREEEAPVCSPSLIGETRPLTPEEILAFPLLTADTRPRAWDRWFEHAGLPHALRGASLRRFDHFYLALQAATDGLGFALGPLPLIVDDLASGRLVCPIDGLRLSTSPYCWYVAEHRRADPLIVAFTDWLELSGGQAVSKA